MFKKINWIIVYIYLLVMPVIVLAAEWQDPPSGSVPPENNIDRPITIGTRADHKLGPITTNSYFATEANSAMSTILQGQGICFRDNSSGNYYNCTNTDENNIQGSISLKTDNTAKLLKLFSSSGKVAINGISEVNFDLANPELQLVYGVDGTNGQEKHWSWYVDSTGVSPTQQLRLWGGANLSNQLVVSQAGDVGLGGNINPAYKLDVIGRVNATGGLCINGDCKSSWNDITGMWHTGTDNSIVNNDSRRVGINTEDPLSTLEVNGVIGTTPYGGYFRANPLSVQDNYGYLSSAGQINGAGLKFETTEGPETSTGKTRLILENDGNIGQNTDGGPATTFEIQSDNYDPTQLRVSDFVSNPEIQLQYSTNDNDHWAIYVSNDINGDGSLNFWNPIANANVFSIDLDGNVGIKNNLNIYNDAKISRMAYIGDTNNINAVNSLVVAQSLSVGVSGSVNSTGQLSVARSDSWYSNFAKSGDMVMRSSNADLILTARNASGAIRFGTGASDTEKMTIVNNGNIGIGTINPSAKLEINGQIKISDGTQGVDKILTSDANGLASWKDIPIQSFWDRSDRGITFDQGGGIHIADNNLSITNEQRVNPSGSGAEMTWNRWTQYTGETDFINQQGSNTSHTGGGFNFINYRYLGDGFGWSNKSIMRIDADGRLAVGSNIDSLNDDSKLNTNGNQLFLSNYYSGPIIGLAGNDSYFRGITIYNLGASHLNTEDWFYGANNANDFVIRRAGSTDEVTINSSGTTINNLCLGGVCKTAWPAAGGSPYGTTGWVQYNNNGSFGASNNFTWLNNKLNVGSIVLDSALSKLTVSTIDPVYKIDNQKYATFMAGMTGVKEETTAVMRLEYKPELGYYYGQVKFDQTGSDLWLFAKAANLQGEGLANVVVVLSPNFKGNTWYEKDQTNNTINIYAQSDLVLSQPEISYRLTAPRFDYRQWPNKIKTNEIGFDLDKLIVK